MENKFFILFRFDAKEIQFFFLYTRKIKKHNRGAYTHIGPCVRFFFSSFFHINPVPFPHRSSDRAHMIIYDSLAFSTRDITIRVVMRCGTPSGWVVCCYIMCVIYEWMNVECNVKALNRKRKWISFRFMYKINKYIYYDGLLWDGSSVLESFPWQWPTFRCRYFITSLRRFSVFFFFRSLSSLNSIHFIISVLRYV